MKTINPNIINKVILTGGGLAFMVLVLVGLPWQEARMNYLSAVALSLNPIVEDINYLDTLELSARSAIIYHPATDKIIYELNATDHIPIASVTKLMTVLAAAEILSPETTITIQSDEAGVISSAGIRSGETWTFKDLSQFTLMNSSNGAAEAIARRASEVSGDNFINIMNQTAATIGLNNTFFVNSTGLDVGGEHSGSYSTAKEISQLTAYLWQKYPELFSATSQTEAVFTNLSGTRYRAINTNQDMNIMPSLVASKTGYTGNAGGNLSVVVDIGPGDEYVIVALGSTREARTEDISQMITALIGNINIKNKQ